YTGALIANTAVPVWHEGRRWLPFLFGASAASSAGAVGVLAGPAREAGPARRLALAGAAASNALSLAMELRAGFVGEAYRQGKAGKLNLLAKVATAGGAIVLRRAGRKNSRRAHVAGSAMILGGELALRFAVFEAGRQSARDPRYTILPQRRRLRDRPGGRRRDSRACVAPPRPPRDRDGHRGHAAGRALQHRCRARARSGVPDPRTDRPLRRLGHLRDPHDAGACRHPDGLDD